MEKCEQYTQLSKRIGGMENGRVTVSKRDRENKGVWEGNIYRIVGIQRLVKKRILDEATGEVISQ